MARAFSTNQKLSLLVKANFHCQICGCKISFDTSHADHVEAYSKGGKTILSNGQALCAPCNLKKGDKPMNKLLHWQQDNLAEYKDTPYKKDYVLVAGTGCGKTKATVPCAKYEMSRHESETIIFVTVPFRGIKGGWKRAFEAVGLSVASKPSDLAEDTQVFISTYAGAGSMLKYVLDNFDKKLIIIFDEFHHMEETNSWAEPFVNMDEERYVKRIFLSGTPWHEKGTISDSMVTYENTKNGDIVASDFTYTYGQNVYEVGNDKNTVAVAFRPFHTITSDKRVNKKTGKEYIEVFDTKEMSKSDSMWPLVNFSDVVQMVQLEGVMKVLSGAVRELEEARKVIPKAAGIIFVKDKAAGESVLSVMETHFGKSCLLVTSDDPQSHKRLGEFRGNYESWIISIDMISEGVDIPRLKVVADLTNKLTMMHIIQRWGRVLRLLRKGKSEGYVHDKNIEAKIFYIAHPKLQYVAEEIERDLRKFKKKKKTGGDPPTEKTYDSVGTTQTASRVNGVFQHDGIELDVEAVANWIILKNYRGVNDRKLGYKGALFLAEEMVASDTIPDECKDYILGLGKEEIVELTSGQLKQAAVDEYTEVSNRIARRFFDKDYKKSGKYIIERGGNGKWTRDHKTLKQLKERGLFLREVERELDNEREYA